MNPATPVTTAFTGSTILCGFFSCPRGSFPCEKWDTGARRVSTTRRRTRSSSATPRSLEFASPNAQAPAATARGARCHPGGRRTADASSTASPGRMMSPAAASSRKPAGLPGGGDDHRSPDGTAVEQLRGDKTLQPGPRIQGDEQRIRGPHQGQRPAPVGRARGTRRRPARRPPPSARSCSRRGPSPDQQQSEVLAELPGGLNRRHPAPVPGPGFPRRSR